MTDYEMSCKIWVALQDMTSKELKNLHKTHEIIADRNMGIRFEKKGATSRQLLKANGEIAIEIPKLTDNAKELATASIALAVGRRLERFERGLKANANRTAESRQKIAQNAIQSRWSA